MGIASCKTLGAVPVRQCAGGDSIHDSGGPVALQAHVRRGGMKDEGTAAVEITFVRKRNLRQRPGHCVARDMMAGDGICGDLAIARHPRYPCAAPRQAITPIAPFSSRPAPTPCGAPQRDQGTAGSAGNSPHMRCQCTRLEGSSHSTA